jgi:hypothetical protein
VRELISKLVAGGLSAAVILIWWPRFFPADNATTWLVRGVVWTLSFELLLHALLPIERALWDSRAGERFRSAGGRLGAPRQSIRGRAGVACAALAVPVALLVAAPPEPVKPKTAAAVRHVTEVKRIVKVERRQVRVAQVVPVAPESPQTTSPAPTLSYSKPVVRSKTRAQQQSEPRKSTPVTGNSSSGTKSTTGSSQTTATTPEQVAAAPTSTGR